MRPDGLYRIVRPGFIAGFELFDGQVVACAPILKSDINHWKWRGDYIAPSTAKTRKKHRKIFQTEFEWRKGK
jgi:hypothetical protein